MVNHDFNLGNVVYIIDDNKTEIKIVKCIVTGVSVTPAFAIQEEDVNNIIKNKNKNYTVYPLTEHEVPSKYEGFHSPNDPLIKVKYSVNPIDKFVTLNSNRVFSSVDDLLFSLKETAR